MTASDGVFLMAATELAEAGRFTCSPNPPVGCLIWRHGEVIGRGYHQRAGEGHAEVNAIADAGHDVAGATVYVSLEPCAVVGRTPACATTLIDARVSRVVAGAVDPNPKVRGEGLRMLTRAGIDTSLLEIPEAGRAIRGFASRMTLGRPLVRLKSASSLDGAIALESGESQWITGPDARADVQYWRARSDAIITGVNTVLADDPALTVRDPTYAQAKPPLRVILDTHLRLPASARVLQDPYPTLLVHAPETRVRADIKALPGVDMLAVDPRSLHAILQHLALQGCNEVLVEAGAAVLGSFIEQRLWDEWVCYLAPKLLGSQSRHLAQFALDSLDQAPGARVADMRRVGNDVRLLLERE